jgi:predicted PurR-regulated permease PerM
MKRWLPISIAILVLYLGAQVVRPFFNAFAWATVVVVTTWPIYSRLRRHLIRSPSCSAFLMTFGIFVIFLLGVIPLSIQLSNELSGIANISPELMKSVAMSLKQKLASLPYVGDLFASTLEGFTFSANELSDLLIKYKQQTLVFAASITKGLLGALASFFGIFFIMFFLFRDGAEIGTQLVTAAHRLGGDRVGELLEIARTTVRAAIFGYLLTAIAQGILAGIAYALTGVPTPISFAALTAIISLLPFGTPFVYVPIILYMFLVSNASLLAIILLTTWCVGVVSAADNIIRPMVISQATSLSFLLVLIGVLGGIMHFGLIGIVLGPVILALIHAIWLGFVRIEWDSGVNKVS